MAREHAERAGVNLPNLLTLLRFALVPFFVLALTGRSPVSIGLALGLFALATLTDYLDGVLARRLDLQTPFGEFMDPLADKILVGAAFITFSILPGVPVPVWLVAVILFREVAVTLMRVAGVAQGRRMKTELAGKVKTAFQMFSITSILVWLIAARAAAENHPGVSLSQGLSFWRAVAGQAGAAVYFIPLVLVAVSAALALSSMVLYVLNNRHLFTGTGGGRQ